MVKRKKLPVRFIARFTWNVEKRSSREFISKRRVKKEYRTTNVTKSDRSYRVAKVFNSLDEVKRYARKNYASFKKTKGWRDWTFNVQAFKGRVGKSPDKLYLTKNSLSTELSRSFNLKKKSTGVEVRNMITRTLNQVYRKVEDEKFSPTVRTKKYKPKEKSVEQQISESVEKLPYSPLLVGSRERVAAQKGKSYAESLKELRGSKRKGKTLLQGVKRIKQIERKRKRK